MDTTKKSELLEAVSEGIRLADYKVRLAEKAPEGERNAEMISRLEGQRYALRIIECALGYRRNSEGYRTALKRLTNPI